MKNLNELVRSIIHLRESGRARLTLLAVCPNSDAVLEAAVLVAAKNNVPMLFAATLNQVDRDGGYTRWTPSKFVARMRAHADNYNWHGPLYPCLDHGGPWLKDLHTLAGLSFEETMTQVKQTLTACLEAGYQLLHIDPTVDRTLPAGQPPSVNTVVARTVEMIEHAESERRRLNLPEIAYEVGTEEVHGGLVDLSTFREFLGGLREGLVSRGLSNAWPSFIVAQVGTDLHTTTFDSAAASRLYDIVSPLGSLIKGHYTDFVENPWAYPETGMGGANLGPEFTSDEYRALRDLCAKEEILCRNRPGLQPSRFLEVLRDAVVRSGRWKKWLQYDELNKEFPALSPGRQEWLVETGARYIWTEPAVLTARQRLNDNLAPVMRDPNAYVVERIALSMDKYVRAFNLFDAQTLLE